MNDSGQAPWTEAECGTACDCPQNIAVCARRQWLREQLPPGARACMDYLTGDHPNPVSTREDPS